MNAPVGGIPEEVEGCGVLVEPRSPSALAKGILALVNDPARRVAMGQAARQRALEQFTLDESNAAHYLSYLRLAYLSSRPEPEVESSMSHVRRVPDSPEPTRSGSPDASESPFLQPSPAV